MEFATGCFLPFLRVPRLACVHSRRSVLEFSLAELCWVLGGRCVTDLPFPISRVAIESQKNYLQQTLAPYSTCRSLRADVELFRSLHNRIGPICQPNACPPLLFFLFGWRRIIFYLPKWVSPMCISRAFFHPHRIYLQCPLSKRAG